MSNIYDQQYILTLTFNLRFIDEKVQSIKAIRQIFGCKLIAAKAIADDYVCCQNMAGTPRRVFLVDGPQLAWAMHNLVNLDHRYGIRGSSHTYPVFTLDKFEPTPVHGWHDITKSDYGTIQ